MAGEAGLELAGSVLETDSVATSLTPPYFDYQNFKEQIKSPALSAGFCE